jgi:hypothetical protein
MLEFNAITERSAIQEQTKERSNMEGRYIKQKNKSNKEGRYIKQKKKTNPIRREDIINKK